MKGCFIRASSYDVIIIGAGLGGLTAAARLVREGLRVLVLDRTLHGGGTAYTFQRRGFYFPMGPLGFSTPAVVRRTFQSLGEGSSPDLIRVHYRLRAFGLDLPLSRSSPELQQELIRLFPEESGGISRFFAALKALAPLLQDFPGEEARRILRAAAAVPARVFLESKIKGGRLKRILGSQGTGEPRGPLLLVAVHWDLLLGEGIWYPAEGLRVLGDRLSLLVTRPPGKGEIRLGAEAYRIRIRGGKVRGVTLSSGEDLEAPVVVSNADLLGGAPTSLSLCVHSLVLVVA